MPFFVKVVVAALALNAQVRIATRAIALKR
jgi:hypothetical protein